jgi:hypothetical protein
MAPSGMSFQTPILPQSHYHEIHTLLVDPRFNGDAAGEKTFPTPEPDRFPAPHSSGAAQTRSLENHKAGTPSAPHLGVPASAPTPAVRHRPCLAEKENLPRHSGRGKPSATAPGIPPTKENQSGCHRLPDRLHAEARLRAHEENPENVVQKCPAHAASRRPISPWLRATSPTAKPVRENPADSSSQCSGRDCRQRSKEKPTPKRWHAVCQQSMAHCVTNPER